LAAAISIAAGCVAWALTDDVVGGVTALVFVLFGGIVMAWQWMPFARLRQVRRGEIEEAWPEPKSATGTTEPLVAWFRKRGRL
jgi:hypothetical protein